MICPFCRRQFPGDYKWCMDDGSELEQDIGQYLESDQTNLNTVPCPDCDEPVDVRDIFCGSCGAKLTGRLPEYVPPANATPDEYIAEQEYTSETSAAQPASEQSATAGRDCPLCGARIALEDTFCGECGAKVEPVPVKDPGFEGIISGAHCKGCSAGLEPDDEYCGVCGMPVGADAAPAPAADANVCSGCGAAVSPDDAFCGECGMKAGAGAPAPQQSGAVCPGCGAAASPEDTFCGECGFNLSATAPAASTPAAPSAPNQTASKITECPNCGMDVAPGDSLCNVCGFDLTQDIQRPPDLGAPEEEYVPEPEPEPIEIIDPFGGKGMKPEVKNCPSCGLQVPPGAKTCVMCGASVNKGAAEPEEPLAEEPSAPLSASACPNCGMDIGPDDTFCGTCGHSLSEPAPTDEIVISAQPETEERLAPASIADITSDIPVCPGCGVEGEPGASICLACGTPLKEAGELESEYIPDERAEPALSLEDASAGYVDEYASPPEIASEAAPAPSQAPGGGADVKICSCCGLECPSDAEFCAGCGVDFD